MSEKGNERQARQAERDAAMDEKLRHDFHDPEARKKRKRNIRIGFCITFAILLIASVVNWGIVSSWGQVEIERVKATGDNGAEWSALVYRPNNATDETPAPAVIMWHGNAGNARNHESWAMEFARRGFVVVAPDLNGSGDATYTTMENKWDEQLYWFDYMMGLPFIDTENVLCTGHSAGATPAWDIGSTYDVKGVLVAAGCSVFDGHYGVPEGANRPGGAGTPEPTALMEEWYEWAGNTVICMGAAEMSNYSVGYDWNNFLQVEALQVLQKYPGHENDTYIEPNHLYGSFEDGDGFIFCVEDYRIHEAAFVSQNTIGNLLNYGQQIVGDAVPNPIDWHDQVWPIKDYVGLFCMFAFAAWLCSLALLLIEEVPVFGKIRRPLGKNIGFRGIGLIVATVIGIVVPYFVMKTDGFGIVGGSRGDGLTALGFHMRYANLGFGVVIGLAIVATVGLVVYLLTERKKKNVKLVDFGLTPADYDSSAPMGAKAKSVIGMVLRTALLSFVVIVIGWTFLAVQLDVAGTDYYAWFFGVKDIPLAKLPAYAPYVASFIILFIPLAIDMNVTRRLPSTGNETKDLIIAMAVNLVVATAAIILVVAVKWHLQSTDMWLADGNWFWGMGMDTQRIWGLPAGMTIASCGATFLYRKTGNLWLCSLLIGVVACLLGMLYGQYQFDFLTNPNLQ